MPTDEDELRLKRYEQLLEYSRRTFDFHLKRWDDSEAKVARFTTMLLALLGAGAFSIRRVADAVAEAQPGWAVLLWVQFYGLFAVGAVVSFTFYLWAFYYRDIPQPEARQSVLLPVFDSLKYVDVLVTLSKSYLAAAEDVKATVARVQRAAHRGYLCFIFAVFCGLMSAMTYAIVDKEARDAKRAAVPATAAPPTTTTFPAGTAEPTPAPVY